MSPTPWLVVWMAGDVGADGQWTWAGRVIEAGQVVHDVTGIAASRHEAIGAVSPAMTEAVRGRHPEMHWAVSLWGDGSDSWGVNLVAVQGESLKVWAMSWYIAGPQEEAIAEITRTIRWWHTNSGRPGHTHMPLAVWSRGEAACA